MKFLPKPIRRVGAICSLCSWLQDIFFKHILASSFYGLLLVISYKWFYLHFHCILSLLAPPAASEVKEADWWNCGVSSLCPATRNPLPGIFFCPCVSMWHLLENLLDSKLGHSSHVAPPAVGHRRAIFQLSQSVMIQLAPETDFVVCVCICVRACAGLVCLFGRCVTGLRAGPFDVKDNYPCS